MCKRAFVIGAVMVAVVAGSAPAQAAGNGYLMMVHARFEPRINEVAPVPPVPEAIAATRDGDVLIFNAIPHKLDARPVRVSSPTLEIKPIVAAGTASARTIVMAPNGDPAATPECVEETQYAGHEGPLDACLVFRVPASSFQQVQAVRLTLRFRPFGASPSSPVLTENYNLAAHVAIHDHQNSGQGDLAVADAMFDRHTPFATQRSKDLG